jgi:phosphoglycerate dehydrogenase-like enzyme
MRLAILDDFQNVVLSAADWSVIEDRVDITVFNDHLEALDEVAERLADFEIVVIIRERTKFPRALFEKLPNFKLLITGGMRNRGIDLAAAKDHRVTVCGTGGAGAPTSELTWGLILATVRNISEQVQAVHEGGWQVGLGLGLQGKTLGIIGLGRQGTAVAKVAKAFDMDVAAWSQNLTKERCAEQDVRFVESKEELLAQSDMVTIHLILSDRSKSTINAEALTHMKECAYLFNTSRGPIVDEDALIAAVKGGQIAGAGLDVFDIEPLPADHPYRNTPGIVPTPHLGYVSLENYQVYFGQGIEDIEAWFKGEPVRVLEG